MATSYVAELDEALFSHNDLGIDLFGVDGAEGRL